LETETANPMFVKEEKWLDLEIKPESLVQNVQIGEE
jgi:hypothetical protein